MNRRERRLAVARNKATGSTLASIPQLLAEATEAFEQGQAGKAEVICAQILARAPAHAPNLNLLGTIYNATGRHRLAIKVLSSAISSDDRSWESHYKLGVAYQALDKRATAATHYQKAMALGMTSSDVEQALRQKTLVMDSLSRFLDKLNYTGKADPIFRDGDIETIARDPFMIFALTARIISGVALEFFLTSLRFELLRIAEGKTVDAGDVSENVTELFCAVAKQCFMNEYIFDQSAEETQRADQLQRTLVHALSNGGAIAPILIAAVGAYFPLQRLTHAEALLTRPWPSAVTELLRQQVQEPLEEALDCDTIPAITDISDGVSLEVMRQYQENPYPRWTGGSFAGRPKADETDSVDSPDHGSQFRRILIAGCGTGEQAIIIGQSFPESQVLAIDLSRTSLAYARRKTQEYGLGNIEYAQADILRLKDFDHAFDRIDATGVLHHLSDPKAGWRALLSLLRPGGVMRIGLYSEAARRPVVAARKLIAEHGYRAIPADIRAFRRTITRNWQEPRWGLLLSTVDFYSVSGCRDMLFNAMEHRFTIPEIATFINEHGLSFLGFELEASVIESFQQRNPDAEAIRNLDRWDAFERDNPNTFTNMYLFSVRKN